MVGRHRLERATLAAIVAIVGCAGKATTGAHLDTTADAGDVGQDAGASVVGEPPGASACNLAPSNPAGTPPSCAYTDDASFCKCLGNYDCGAITVKDAS